MNQEFYVGYVPKPPANLAKWLKRLGIGGVLAAALVALLLTLRQPPFANSTFEFGVERDYAGVIEEWPYPILRTPERSYLLVAPGKHGLAPAVKGFEGRTIHLKGTLIERGEDRMLEVRPQTIQPLPAVQSVPGSVQRMELGRVRLGGEIVDTKCYLGVMNPGEGKVHRDCAARCISGGAPPAFIAKDARGTPKLLLLAGPGGRPLDRQVLRYVAEPIEIDGMLVRQGSHLVLEADPGGFFRSAK